MTDYQDPIVKIESNISKYYTKVKLQTIIIQTYDKKDLLCPENISSSIQFAPGNGRFQPQRNTKVTEFPFTLPEDFQTRRTQESIFWTHFGTNSLCRRVVNNGLLHVDPGQG